MGWCRRPTLEGRTRGSGRNGLSGGARLRSWSQLPVGERERGEQRGGEGRERGGIQPAVCTPCRVVIRPKANAIGRNTIQEIAPAPEATPARIVDGTASCSSRVTWMLATR